MSALSDDIVTRIVGYLVEPGNFSLNAPNLPAMIAIHAEANDDFQTVISAPNPSDPPPAVQITSDVQAANLGGWGSPIYQIAKQLFPAVGSIPVWVFPQLKASGATPKVLQVAVTGTATNNGTHYIVVAGRKEVGGQSYAVNISQGDDAATVHSKIEDVIQSVLGCPLKAISTDYYAELTGKWSGKTNDDVVVSMDTNGNSLGLTYSITNVSSGAGTPSGLTASLGLLGNKWFTHVINSYGLLTTIMGQYEAFNGRPVVGTNQPTGRYLPTVFKPFMVYSGTTQEDDSNITDARSTELTIKSSVAPKCLNLPMEVAADDCLLSALQMQLDPSLDVIGQSYPGIVTPEEIGVMSSWVDRDRMVKKGLSTVDLVGGTYQIQDPVTTYHLAGEVPPAFRYPRNIFIDWNTRFTYEILERQNVLNKVIFNDPDKVGNGIKAIKPKIWKAILAQMAEDMVARGLWVDAQFTIDSLQVSISTTNPDRFKTSFKYKRSGVVRQADTVATAGFNVGVFTIN